MSSFIYKKLKNILNKIYIIIYNDYSRGEQNGF